MILPMPVGMVTAISAAAGGMQYAQQAMDVAANNIANVDTPAFSADVVVGDAGNPTVVTTGNPTDLSFQIPAMNQAKFMMEANVAVMKQAQAMYDSVLQLLPH